MANTMLESGNKSYYFICPKCADTAQLYELRFICEGCTETYRLSACDMPDTTGTQKIDTKKIHKHLITFDSSDSGDITTDQEEDGVSVKYAQDVYTMINDFKKKYNFASTEDVLRVMFEGFMLIFQTIETAPGSNVFLIDSKGNKSPNLKTLSYIMHLARKRKAKEQNKQSVSEFIFKIQKLMKVWKDEQEK